jgi:hypothetical protein
MQLRGVESMTRRHGRRRSGNSIAEFGPALWFFLILIVVPLIDLFSFAIGVGVTMMLSTWGARQAAPCSTYTEAIQSLDKTETQMATFRGFCRMTPTAGGGKGYSMKVTITPIAGGASTSFTTPGGIPNQPPPDSSAPDTPALNTMNCIYQYVVTARYDVAPIFNFSALPFLKDVPALGKSVPVTFLTSANVEHPEGLNQ